MLHFFTCEFDFVSTRSSKISSFLAIKVHVYGANSASDISYLSFLVRFTNVVDGRANVY